MRAVVALSLVAAARGVALRTRARVPNCTPNNLHAFLATPRNWPDIVLSSAGVEGAAADAPLERDGVVDELFGLPPVLPLRVAWRCEATDPNEGLLDVRSADGLAGVAKDCRMLFDVSADGDASVVELEMSYEPISPIAVLAAPVLIADNFLALNILLPRAIARAGEAPT